MMQAIQLDLGREWRGGQRQVLYLARHLLREGSFAPLVAAPKGAPLLDAARGEGIPVFELPGRREWSPGSFRAVNRLLRQGAGIHILHTHCARSAALAALLRLLSGVRFHLVHTRRVSYPLKGFWSVEKYRLADRVAAVSGEIAAVLERGGLPREKIRVIHSGIDPTRYPVRERGALPDMPRVIGFVGALTPQKGLPVLLDALALLREGNPPAFKALIVGEGALRPDLERKARDLGLGDLTRFLGFRESREVMPSMDVLAVPSVDGEGSSGVVKEAWVTGLPVVCSSLPSNLELVEPGVSGLAVGVGDAHDLAEALRRLLTEPELARSLVEGGRRRVASFTDTAMARAYLDLYREMIARNGS